jgi:glycine dehydrogenase
MNNLDNTEKFVNRHIGPDENEVKEMLAVIGVSSLDKLIDETVPAKIRLKERLNLDKPMAEYRLIQYLGSLAKKNKIQKSYIGLGYYGTITPSVILRNILENPGWYTQYTPYQAEISQGRLEALINYQTVVADLTGLPVANASLLDEGTAAAEAMLMFRASRKPDKKTANKFFVSRECFPQTIDVIMSRAEPHGIEVIVGDHKSLDLTDDLFGILVQYPACDGEIYDYKELFEKAHAKGIFTAVAADIMSLAILTPPGEFGADVAVGLTQRFGVPMGFGGPHAAYFACKDDFRRLIPGRIIGASIDSNGNKAYRMALQTREQHIRREKATSNICTAQVLLAIMAGMYAVYHGPNGIKQIASRIHNLSNYLDKGLKQLELKQVNKYYFDTLKVDLGEGSKEKLDELRANFEAARINLRYYENRYIGISVDEAANLDDIRTIISIFAGNIGKDISALTLDYTTNGTISDIPANILRKSPYLKHQVFHKYHSETEMMRYIYRLEKKDLSLTGSMIPLGSCTMKLNAATEMMPITWPEFGFIHPFAPANQTEGYHEIFKELEKQLEIITGLPAVSLQPNSGAQGEFTGLMVIREYHKSRGDLHRDVVLIPASAHGTNPASAVMAGMKVVVVKCKDNGDIDIDDLKLNAEKYKDNLSALMVTYPSTHGVFEEDIKEMCEIIHSNGGQVYMDGANLNAQVGLTTPAIMGADVCHINLHKTFSIPHGGGGPGMGPIAVAKHLAPFLPGHPLVKVGGEKHIHAVSAAPWGSASVLVISYAYILLMGEEGLTYATKIAILNANYLKAKLEKYYPVVYSGSKGRNAHELIFDMRQFKKTTGIEVEDISKRLMDYGFHAPTVSFPVHGTFMVEPTESESKFELDRFCDAMIAIKEEIQEIEDGKADAADNVLKNAPHTAMHIASSDWKHPYSREKAAYPIPGVEEYKFWPAVGRVDNAYGDRNFMCTCDPVEAYAEAENNL